LIKILYNENGDTNLPNNDIVFYYILLVVDCVIRYKNFVFLTSKNSKEVAEAFKSIYNNPDNLLTWPHKS